MSAIYHRAVALSFCCVTDTHVSVRCVEMMSKNVLYLASELTYDIVMHTYC